MTIRCILNAVADNESPTLDISREDFENIKKAKDILNNCLEMEILYEMLIQNYSDLVVESVKIANSNMLFKLGDKYRLLQNEINLTRRLVNLFSSSRMYRDQIKHLINPIDNNKQANNDIINQLYTEEKEHYFAFKFIEELRNYVQHRGLPIHCIRPTMYRNNLEDQADAFYLVEIWCNKSQFVKDTRFDKSVVNMMPDEIELMQAVRVYIERISVINTKIRKRYSKNIDENRRVIENSINLYKLSRNGTDRGVFALRISGNKIDEMISLSLDFDEIRSALSNQNVQLKNLNHRHVTTAAYRGVNQK